MGTVAVGERVEDAGAESVPGLTYRPYLDGLRAVAVYLVVVFHAGSRRFLGGYVGVDVFFVLSGFLVTQLLLRDLGRTGSIRFGRFYSRRYRRLLPAAFVALVVTAVVYTAIASPAEVADAVGSFKAAFLYVTNWYFIHQATGYFGANILADPVLPFWSLAIEEQFYLIWPLTLGGIFFATRRLDPARRIRLLQIAVAVAVVASAAWALSLRSTDPNRAYYGTDTRAYQLLAGALLALIPTLTTTAQRHRTVTRAAAIAATAALLYIASSWTHLDAIQRGIAVTITTCILLIALEAADGGVIQRILSDNRVVYLGKISYGTYLWHWLVILVIARSFQLSTITTIAIACLLATALASLSYELLERPIRISTLLDQHRIAVIAAGITISIISALVLIPKLVNPAHATTPPLQSTPTNNNPQLQNVDLRGARDTEGAFPSCYRKPADECTTIHGTGPHILLIGDSHARMLIPTLTAIANTEHLTLSIDVRGGCPWQRNLYVTRGKISGVATSPEACAAQKEDLYTRVLPTLHPDLVIAANYGYEAPGQFARYVDANGEVLQPGPVLSSRVQTTTTNSITQIRATGAKLAIIEPIPLASRTYDPITCLAHAQAVEECAYVTSARPDRLELAYRQFAKEDSRDIFSVDLDRVVCPYLPICDPVIDNTIVKWDSSHLTIAFARSIAPQLAKYLEQSGALPN